MVLKVGIWELTLLHDWQLLPKNLNKLISKNITLTMKLIIDCSKQLIDTWCGKKKKKKVTNG